MAKSFMDNNNKVFDNPVGVSDARFLVDDETATMVYDLCVSRGFKPMPVKDNTVSAPVMSAPTPAPAPVRVLATAEDCFAPLTIIKTRSKKNVAFTIGYGALDKNGKKMTGLNAHNACKVLVKESGFKWDSEIDNKGATKSGKGAYVGTVEDFEKLGVVDNNVPVAAVYFDKARAKAQAKEERRARKAARA